MLNVIIGLGVRVRVVKEERVMPRNWEGCVLELLLADLVGREVGLAVVVSTTTEWGRARISVRREVESGGSSFCVAAVEEFRIESR